MTSTTWSAQTIIAAPALDDSDEDAFGRSVAISAQLLITGAVLSDVDATDAGSAYVHTLIKGQR
ncbi:MAG: FG-GAP repeat protein [Sandaracinaceae bacterium]|nr:FG-GAP repeat protein [Sandaracinaceae bacterium]